MALVPHKITALAESDADGTDGKNIVSGAVVSLFDTTGAAVTLFDDEAGNNGSTAKQTDSSGQVVVWVTPGEYSESVNGSTQRAVTIGGRTVTSYPNTESLQNSRPTQTGQRAENRERDNAQYELAESGYAAVIGDVVAANGRVWKLDRSGSIDIVKFGVIPTGGDDSTLLNSISSTISGGGDFTVSKPYTVSSRWLVSSGSDFKIRFVGEGKVTRSGGTSTVFEVTGSNNFEVFNPVIDGGGAGGSHGLVISNCDDSKVHDPVVTNFTNTGILVFGTVADTYARNYIFNPVVDGLGVANNGILIGDLNDSHAYNASVKGCAGSPGIGLQLKNECNNCSISGTVDDCFVGLGFGRESVVGVQNSKAEAVVRGCTAGFQASGASGNSVNVKIDMLGAGENAIDWQQNCNNNYTAAEVQNMAAGKSIVRMIGDSGVLQNNIVDLNQLNNIANSVIANFGSTATRNTVNIKKWDADPAVVDGVMSRVTDASGAGTNTIGYSDQTVYINEPISSGVVALKTRGIKLLIVDTEASASADNLDSITGTFYDGDTLMVRSQSNVRDVTVKHGVGNILLNGSADFVLSGVADSLLLMYNANISSWTQLSGNNVT